jgi:hypothetical protein
MLIIIALLVVLLFTLNFAEDVEYIGAAVPMSFVAGFFLTYTNWLSMKFFVNS